MTLRILVLGPVAPETVEALKRLDESVELLPEAEAHELLSRVAADQPHLVVTGSAAVDWAGSSSLLHQVLGSEFARAVRYRHPLSVVLLGVDGAPRLAETHGEEAIDGWRAGLAGALRRSLRQIDVVARTADDEIAILLPETTIAGARVVAERARALASRLIVKSEGRGDRKALPVKATISVGICDVPRDGIASSAAFLDAARGALDRARALGGDRAEDVLP